MSQGVRNSVLRKIIITSVIGGITFPLTNLLFDSLTAQFIAAVSVGAISLVVQFLIDFERRLAAVEQGQHGQTDDLRRAVDQGFAKVSAATQLFARLEEAELKTDAIARLVGQAAAIEPGASPLLVKFVETEMNRMTELLGSVGQQELTYEGEDREWLLGLTRSVSTSIDAISISTVDNGRAHFEHGFWWSDLGQHYLSAQQAAIRRGARVRRLFVVVTPEHADDHELLSVCRLQASLGIEVRVLNVADMTSSMKATRLLLNDFIVFDDVVSYEVVQATRIGITDPPSPPILYTRLVSGQKQVGEQIERFRHFWEHAKPQGDSSPG
ncbi:hypothetical protein LWC34_50765 [Kibdelosporangium philippinense]|uniref:DUF6879 domain-containing protein n=1 Tax=Kibdelosporangium philippinense TaxID=211113 RepID=A0ABS8ZVK2_9PSEU|nr:hypothetical protein [Kibdelosporangium philippinense]MCE7011035.1 hypothetical protein [Kibdelosporangium philippinense]